jgi:hypothetical protein
MLDAAQKAINDRIVERARSAVGKGIRYGLGKGGYRPNDPLPARVGPRSADDPTRARWCDCSGFIAWCCGVSRHRAWSDFAAWFSTDSIYTDAGGAQRHFVEVAHGAVEAGDLLVYPDWRDDAGKLRQGHVAVVVEQDFIEDNAGRWCCAKSIIDCSGSQDGVTERQPKAGGFTSRRHRTRIVRLVRP